MDTIESDAVYPTIDVPSFDMTGSSDTCVVWMFAAATPAPSTAAMTAFVSAALRLSAVAAVVAFVWTLKSNSAWSGTAVTVPVPSTVTVSPVAEPELVAASAPPASSATASARATRSFMPDIRCRAPRMSHA